MIRDGIWRTSQLEFSCGDDVANISERTAGIAEHMINLRTSVSTAEKTDTTRGSRAMPAILQDSAEILATPRLGGSGVGIQVTERDHWRIFVGTKSPLEPIPSRV